MKRVTFSTGRLKLISPGTVHRKSCASESRLFFALIKG